MLAQWVEQKISNLWDSFLGLLYLNSANVRLCPGEAKRESYGVFPQRRTSVDPMLITDTEEVTGSIPVSPTILWPSAPLG